MTRTARGWRASLIAVAGLAVIACQSTPTTAPTQGAATASPATVASAGPSPSAAAVDVAPLFAQAIKNLDSGVVSMDGSATVGPVRVTISGTSTFDGPDSKGKITTTVAGNSTVVETVKVAGKAYSKTGDGPWLATTATSGSDLSSSLKDSAASSYTDKGVITRKGASVHQLEASGGSAFDPNVFLSSATGVSNIEGTTTFYCKDDGTPVGATIELTWTQAAGGASLDASMSFEIDFSSLGSSQTIAAPESVWKRFNADKRGYSIAYPPDYDHTARQGYDYFVGPDDSFYFGSRTDAQGFTLNLVAKSETSSIKSTLKTKAVSNEEITVGGLPGRLLSATGTNADLGGKVVFYEAIVMKGKFAYFIAWVSKVGSEEADLATFLQAVATFQFLA